MAQSEKHEFMVKYGPKEYVDQNLEKMSSVEREYVVRSSPHFNSDHAKKIMDLPPKPRSDSYAVKGRTIRRILDVDHEATPDIWAYAANHKNADVRFQAAGMYSLPQEHFNTLLHDRQPEVRQELVHRHHDSTTFTPEHLEYALTHKDAAMRAAAASSESLTPEQVTRAARDKQWNVRFRVVGKLSDPDYEHLIKNETHHDVLRYAGIKYGLKPEYSKAIFHKLANHPDQEHQSAAAGLLRTISDHFSDDELLDLEKNEKHRHNVIADQAVTQLVDRSTPENLKKLTKHPSMAVADSARSELRYRKRKEQQE